MLLPAQMVPSSGIFNDSSTSVCPDCLDPVGTCTCSWQILQLDASYSIYTTLNEDMNKATPTSSYSFPSDLLKLDGLNCGGIPTRTTPTLTPTTLRTIAADIAGMSPGTSEEFAASAASDLHHLVSSSCTNINVPSSVASDHLGSEDRLDLQKLTNQHLNLHNLNNQHLINNLQNSQHLNQQQQNDYNNSFSTAASRQAGFVPPLVLQINANPPQSSSSTALLNSNNSGSSSIFSAKGSSTSASSSHWQGVVVTQRPQRQSRSVNKRRFTDDENGDDDYDSVSDDGTDDSSDTTSGKTTRKQNSKNSKSKTTIKSEFKNVGNSSGSGRRSNKDNKIMSAEEEHRRQIRRERNKLAAARCRKRRMDHTNELLEETEQLEDKRLRLQVEIQGLRQQKTNLQQMLAQHKCAVSMNNASVPNPVTTVNQSIETLDSISESDTAVISNNMSTTKRNRLHQQDISTNVNTENDSNNIGDIMLVKCEEPSLVLTDDDNKDNIPITVLQQPQRRRPTTLLQLNNVNFGNNKKMSENGSNGVVVLNFDSLMDGGTGLTPVSTSVGSVQNHHQQVKRSTGSDVSTANNSVLS